MRSQKENDTPQMDTSPEVHCRQVRPQNREIAASHLRTFDFVCVAGAMPALQAAEEIVNFVIPSKARNLSFFSWAKTEERFLAPLGMTKWWGSFSAACLAAVLTC
jgi:hypothetical protein